MQTRFYRSGDGEGRGVDARALLRWPRVLAVLGVAACAACAPRNESPRLDAEAVKVRRSTDLAAGSVPAPGAAATFHSGVRWERIEPEPDPSALAVAAYER